MTTALIVEDDIVLQSHFASIVRRVHPNVKVERVSTAEDAVKRLDNNMESSYCLIIADQYLNGSATGMDLWHYCCKYHPQIKFVLTSGERLRKLLDRLAVPSPEFLVKPFSIQQAIEKIQTSPFASAPELPHGSKNTLWGFLVATICFVTIVTHHYKIRTKGVPTPPDLKQETAQKDTRSDSDLAQRITNGFKRLRQ